MKPICFTIAGSDPCGGAGIQLDLRVFEALEVKGMSVISTITAQNGSQVKEIFPLEKKVFEDQLFNLLENYTPSAIKLGLLSKNSITVLSDYLSSVSIPVILDPVLASSSGYPLLNLRHLTPFLRFPTLITPNKTEAEALSGLKIENIEDMKNVAYFLVKEKKIQSVLIKGGHLNSGAPDVFFNGVLFKEFSTSHIPLPYEVRGTGCFLSSAITAYLAHGEEIESSIEKSKILIEKSLKNARLNGKDRNALFDTIGLA
jgi:hydroxymethylpyrimidine/phosphomethylpyrimidine kinase